MDAANHLPKQFADVVRVSGDGAPAEDEDLVNPWDVQSTADTGVDYDKLISKLVLYFKKELY